MPSWCPYRVVDLLHAVEIDETDEKRRAGPGGQLDVMVCQAEKALTVAQAGQIVDQREVAQIQLEPLALHGVAQCAPQQVVVELGLHEIVLGALVERLDRHLLVFQRAQNDQREVRGRVVNAAHHIEAMSVGKREVEKTDVKCLRGERVDGARHGVDVMQFEGHARNIPKRLPQQTRVAGVVFDEQDLHIDRIIDRLWRAA